MIVQLDPNSNIPLYQQIHGLVVRGIAGGLLKPGDQLPSVRQLAEDLGINLHTVNKAYQGLRDDGYITLSSRNGAVIDLGGLNHERFATVFKEELSDLIAESVCHGYTADQLQELCAHAYKEFSSTDKGDLR